jgi:hypothetical protein
MSQLDGGTGHGSDRILRQQLFDAVQDVQCHAFWRGWVVD